MTIIQSIVLGIVEGVTEFLPISSTAHLILTSRLLGLETTDFLKTFEIVIQSGAILAVVILYAKRILLSWELFKKLVIAFIPTVVVGFFVYPFVRDFLGNSALAAWALIIGGILIILFESRQTVEGGGDISNSQSFLVGVAQTLAFVPGVSRAAATILGGRGLGISRKNIVEFSFLLAIPTMFAATGYDVYKNYEVIANGDVLILAIGSLAAFISALVVIRWFLAFAQRSKLTAFGVYRIFIGGLWLLLK